MITELRRRTFLLGAATMLSLPLTALLGGCGSGGGGGGGNGGGGGGGGNPDVAPFTVTPDRAAPGTMVTLTGAMVRPDQTVTIRFGDVLTRVFGYIRDGATDGVRVLVPPFLNAGGQHVDPGAPVTITVQVEGYAARAANNAFTVLPLPPAPGASAAVATELAAFGDFLGDFTENMIRQISFEDGPRPPYPSTNEFHPCTALIQHSRAIQYLIDGGGQSNPYSLVALLTKQSPITADLPVSQDTLDSLIAQGPAAAILQELARNSLGALEALSPGIISVTASRSREGSQDFDNFSKAEVNWTKLEPVEAVKNMINLMQWANWLTNLGTFTSGFELATAIGMPVAQTLSVGVGPLGAVAYAGLDIALFVEGLVSKLLGAYAAYLPSKVNDFYVEVNGQNRHSGDPSVDIPLRLETPLRMMLRAASAGGPVLSINGFIALAVDIAGRTFPPLKAFFEHHQGIDIIKSIALSVINVMDYVWQKVEGAAPSSDWSQYKASADKVPVITVAPIIWPPININQTSLVTAQSFSDQLLGIKVVDDAYRFVGLALGDNAGYKVFMSQKSLSPNLPSIAQIAAEQFFVVGTVNIAGGTVHGTVD